MTLEDNIIRILNKDIEKAENKELYFAISELLKEKSYDNNTYDLGRKLYYVSAEFLIGRLLINNLINLGLYDEINEILKRHGKNLSDIEEIEPEPSLGNGGLGRLAACFLDSIATLNLNGDGVGLLYHFGLFKQKFIDNYQNELPDRWIENESWLNKTNKTFKIDFGGFSCISRMYEIDVTGYKSRTNKLRLFDIETVDEKIINSGIDFPKDEVLKNLTLFLYPDDSTESGKLLRLYQEYFMSSCAARLIIDECMEKHMSINEIDKWAVIQINDTHPTLIIPEMIRLLIDNGMTISEAIEKTKNMCAYTNHTIMQEALEKWDISMIEKVCPNLLPIIEVLDNRVRRRFKEESVYIINAENQVNMAYMAIHYTFSTNGVAKLHTEILKETELKNFYNIYPERFNNKTNGITERRWLFKANPNLTKLIDGLIGDGFKKDLSELKKLLEFKDKECVLESLLDIKHSSKVALSNYIKKIDGITLDTDSVFDVQIKRIHEYKRQQMNILYVIRKYLDIKSGILPKRPITVIFGGKAAPSYRMAKDVIHLILAVKSLIESDEMAKKYLRVYMAENYNVSYAEKIIPATDISEQISLASKEASGTGNMKLMLNGAITLGTMDGANIEIANLVGKDNIYIFGKSSDEVIDLYKNNSYSPSVYYNKPRIKEAVEFITSETLKRHGNSLNLESVKNELINKDYYMTLLDFESYEETRDKVISDCNNSFDWARKMLKNISMAGFFSSDRTIEEYNKEIWKLG